MDGTKIEANANKYTFVWNKSVQNYDQKLDEKIKKHLNEIDRIVTEENEIYLDEDLEEKGENRWISASQVEAFATFEGRNSYSKTDHDATFMRMKEEAMLNGQLKPGYNVKKQKDRR